MSDPDVDAVYVNTTHNFHAEHALLAIEAGKPVLVEKAFTVTAAEARRVAEAARACGVFAMEAMWTRFLPSTEFVRGPDRGRLDRTAAGGDHRSQPIP